ncbi:hypothetical protein [Brachybacterium sp. p3-SID957]|uniref:hypothetical protein n=1 Tax=Brachybacterium sp. p3-SID957 TaxID=2916049 RepID=UPI00223AF824|nr:hypothetical protein [Brachybacterium sp. p3-SID957]MCT1775974.1 hypothetical protein [Brachybacterium sp. p3-SID957]
MSTPAQRVHEATLALLNLLESGEEATTAEAIELRCELAEATAAAGHLGDAFYQADELLKDAQRGYRPEDPAISRVRRTVAAVEDVARQQE